MTQDEIRLLFSELSVDLKSYMLSLLAHQITVYARGAYPEQQPEREVILKLLTFNEIQHTVTGHLSRILSGDQKRYPDDSFIQILFEQASRGNCQMDLILAFSFAFKHTLKTN
jgi:hypothetical protein